MTTAQLEQRETGSMGRFAKAVATLVVVAGLALPNANAATIEAFHDLGAVSGPLESFALGNAFAGTGDTFVDHWMFSISGAPGLALAAQITLTFSSLIDIDPFATALFYTDIPTLLAVGTNTANLDGSTDSVLIGLLPVTGNYDFVVVGTVTGSLGGAYGGPLHIFTPVPEPEIYAMLAAGLGFMGFVARRRKAQIAAV